MKKSNILHSYYFLLLLIMQGSIVLGQNKENNSAVSSLFSESEKYLSKEGINTRQYTDTAFRILAKAEKMIYPDTTSKNWAELLYLKGYAFMNIDSINAALKLQQKSLTLTGQNDSLTPLILKELVGIYLVQAKIKKALDTEKKRIKLHNKKTPLQQIAMDYNDLGYVYRRCEMFDSMIFWVVGQIY